MSDTRTAVVALFAGGDLTDHPIESPRIKRVEQVSKHRYHNEVKLERPEDLDDVLVGWLREAYALGA